MLVGPMRLVGGSWLRCRGARCEEGGGEALLRQGGLRLLPGERCPAPVLRTAG